jgi:hypothetical protein
MSPIANPDEQYDDRMAARPQLRLFVEHDGILHLALTDLEQYDLSKPMARARVIDGIATTIKHLFRED